MRLTEEQLKTVITETAKKVLKEYAYHEKQNKPSEEEHEAWLRKKSESKKKYMDSQKKKDDGGAIDHYDYKHGKGNFPVMAKESRVRMSAKDFQKFITESVKVVIKEMGIRGYDAWKTKLPSNWDQPDTIDKDDFMDMISTSDQKQQKEFVEYVKEYFNEDCPDGVSSMEGFLQEVGAGENPFMAAMNLGVKWEDISQEFFDLKPVGGYPGDNDPDPRDYRDIDECGGMNETTLDYDMDNFSGRWSRGPRYDILVDGYTEYSDVPDEAVDRCCDEIERKYREWGEETPKIQIIER